jgi:hypothetical protein
MRDRIVHLSDIDHPRRTACGIDWEDWQKPQEKELDIDFSTVPYTARVLMREEDEARRKEANEALYRQCQACLKIALS